jgi:type III pantothenate kinase
MALLGLILGNSTLRCGILEGATVRQSVSVPWTLLRERAPDIAALASRWGVDGAVAGSVRDDLLPTLEEHLPPSCRPPLLARRDFAIPIENLYDRPEEAGTDRLLAACAASRRAGPSGAIAVDFGTAVSLSVVSPAGAFLGGPIAAGASTVARGLEVSTPRLPRLSSSEVSAPPSFLSRDTDSALRSGTWWLVAGGVRALILGILSEVPFRPRVIATGGEAAAFRRAIPEIDEVAPDLVLEGLAMAWAAREHGRRA